MENGSRRGITELVLKYLPGVEMNSLLHCIKCMGALASFVFLPAWFRSVVDKVGKSQFQDFMKF